MNAEPNPEPHTLIIASDVGYSRHIHTGECTCGYVCPLCSSSGRVRELHKEHLEIVRIAAGA